jgi:hypothetical protein
MTVVIEAIKRTINTSFFLVFIVMLSLLIKYLTRGSLFYSRIYT